MTTPDPDAGADWVGPGFTKPGPAYDLDYATEIDPALTPDRGPLHQLHQMPMAEREAEAG
jgi:hypothetical protein